MFLCKLVLDSMNFTGRILRHPHDGGAATTLASDLIDPAYLRFSDGTLYWFTEAYDETATLWFLIAE